MTDDPQAPQDYEITLRAPSGICYTLDRIDWTRPGCSAMNRREAVVVIALMRHALSALECGHPDAVAVLDRGPR